MKCMPFLISSMHDPKSPLFAGKGGLQTLNRCKKLFGAVSLFIYRQTKSKSLNCGGTISVKKLFFVCEAKFLKKGWKHLCAVKIRRYHIHSCTFSSQWNTPHLNKAEILLILRLPKTSRSGSKIVVELVCALTWLQTTSPSMWALQN